MRCPFCGVLEDRVVDSRQGKDGLSIRRRRECESCNGRFTTHERIEDLNLLVIKRGGDRVPFDRDRIRAGLELACRKREVSADQIDRVVDEIERELLAAGERELHSEQIGGLVMERLKALDEVAYVRFASVYRKFEDVQEFMGELQNLMNGRLAGKKPPS